MGIRLELDVTGHDTNCMTWELFFEIRELLIGQGFDRIGCENSLAFAQGLVDSYLPDRGLA